ncbi:MAG: restriction endonuclease subunit S [Polaromonas sp.]
MERPLHIGPRLTDSAKRYPLFVRSQTVERINTYSYDCEAILVPGEGGIGSIFHYINGKFDCHQRVYKIRAFTADTSGKFVFFCMKHLFHKQASRNSVKATVDSLRLPTFLEFEFVAPIREEQEAIVTILSDMDAELAALEARRDKTRALKQGMMQELLTGRIRLV